MIDKSKLNTMDEQSPIFNFGRETGDNITANVVNITQVVLNETSNGSKTAVTPEFPRSFVVICTTFFILIFLFGILGNVCVMSVVCFNRNMKTAVNLYLLNLCVADILVLTICMPTALVEIYTKDAWYFGEVMCKYMLQSCFINKSKMMHKGNTLTKHNIRTIIVFKIIFCNFEG